MVTQLCLCLIASLAFFSESPISRSKPDDAVKASLSKGGFPWYDARTDSARAITPYQEPVSSSQASSSGASASPGFLAFFSNVFVYLGFGLALAVLIGLLIWFWRIYEPTDVESQADERKTGETSRIEALPEGMDREFASSDPWEEAIRRRNRGDLGGAIICLFAHQLLTLSKLGLVRLAPGRTGRQLLKAVSDSELRKMVHPTLRLFEVVFYGHRNPTEAEFAEVWAIAEAFERRIGLGVGS